MAMFHSKLLVYQRPMVKSSRFSHMFRRGVFWVFPSFSSGFLGFSQVLGFLGVSQVFLGFSRCFPAFPKCSRVSTRFSHVFFPRFCHVFFQRWAGDGSALELCRLHEVDDATWAELTDFVATLGQSSNIR